MITVGGIVLGVGVVWGIVRTITKLALFFQDNWGDLKPQGQYREGWTVLREEQAKFNARRKVKRNQSGA